MRTRRPDPEAKLRQLLRVPEEGSYNIADYLAAHGAELGLDLSHIREPDEVVAPRLLQILDMRRSAERATRGAVLDETLRGIQHEAYWRGDQVVLPPARVFQVASTAVGRKHLRFINDDLDVSVASPLLRRAGTALRRFQDVSITVAAGGLRLRWCRGRGGFNFSPQRVKQPTDAIVVTVPSRIATPKMPVLLGEILGEMGYGL